MRAHRQGDVYTCSPPCSRLTRRLLCTRASIYIYIYHSPLAVHQGVVYLQPSEARVRAGATVPLLAAHNGAEMAFTLEEDKLTRKGSDCELLPHPRFDPRWEGARVNLDDQWKQIMQSMARNPKECAAMQEAVMRFAAQPAVFGIDPAVAERCAATFLSE